MSTSVLGQATTALLALSGWPVYAVVGAMAFAESGLFVGLVLPGETAVLLGGVLAAQHRVSLPLLLVIAVVAAVAGDATGFWLGRRLGPRLRGSRLGRRVGGARWDRTGALLERRGPWAIVLGRWIGVLRALTPTVAGASGMPLRRFLPASALGAASWATTVVLLGYSAGATLARAQAVLGTLTGLALATGTVAVVVGWVVARRRRAATARGAAGPAGTGPDGAPAPSELVAAASSHPGA